MGYAQNTDETPTSLDATVDMLQTCAEEIRLVAEKMKLAGIRGPISVRHGRGLHTAIRDTLKPFLADLQMKADRAIEKKRKGRK